MKTILIIANNDVGLYNFRKELLEELLKRFRVYISLPYGERVIDMVNMGCKYIETGVDRRGMNPVKDIKLFFCYIKMCAKIKPDIVISYTIKPNLYGGLATRLFNIRFFPYVAGLGTPFKKEGIVKYILTSLHRVAFKKAERVFFENIESLNYYQQKRIVNNNYIKIPGAGVNLNEYSFTDYPEQREPVTFLFIGRIMKEKGVDELLYSSEKLILNGLPVRIWVIGDMEENYAEKIQESLDKKVIKYFGFQKDVKPFIKGAHCIVLPSYHEGMANVLLEAAAMGRPLITSNVHGCLEAVDDGKTGYLCKVKDPNDLYKKMVKFVAIPYNKQKEMGRLSRRHIEHRFDRRLVVEEIIEVIMK